MVPYILLYQEHIFIQNMHIVGTYTFLEHPSSTSDFSGVRVTRSLVLCVLGGLFFIDIQILFTPLVSSNTSTYREWQKSFSHIYFRRKHHLIVYLLTLYEYCLYPEIIKVTKVCLILCQKGIKSSFIKGLTGNILYQITTPVFNFPSSFLQPSLFPLTYRFPKE